MQKLREIKRDLLAFDRETLIALLLSIFIVGGIFGFIYETIFYIFNNGMILRRGTTFSPIIQLYGWGSLLIFFTCWPFRKKPWQVLLLSGLVCGLLELVVGYLLFQLGNGYRGWDYNTEIWNWGNIGGYVCFRSVAFFAVSGLLLVYVIIPVCLKIIKKIGKHRFLVVCAVITGILLIDILYNDILADRLGWMNARDFYASLGWPYK